MRYVYWEIVGLEDTYTDYDFDYMIEKASGQKFYIGRARLFEKAKPPKRLITKSNKKYQFVDLSDGKWHCKVENKKVGFLNWETRSVFQYTHNYSVQPAGGYFIPELNKYTFLHECAYVRNKKTKKEYKTEEYEFFPKDMDYIPLVEDERDEWEYIRLGIWPSEDRKSNGNIGTNDMLREITVTEWLKK